MDRIEQLNIEYFSVECYVLWCTELICQVRHVLPVLPVLSTATVRSEKNEASFHNNNKKIKKIIRKKHKLNSGWKHCIVYKIGSFSLKSYKLISNNFLNKLPSEIGVQFRLSSKTLSSWAHFSSLLDLSKLSSYIFKMYIC